jgi:hypothetical protein
MSQLTFILDTDPPQSPAKPLHRCRSCKHLVRNMYNSNLKYCELQRSNRTPGGLKKIGSNDAACHKYESIKGSGDGEKNQ